MNKAKQKWTLALHPEHLALAEASDTQPYVILREEMMKSATLVEGMRSLALSKPIKATFKLASRRSGRLALNQAWPAG